MDTVEKPRPKKIEINKIYSFVAKGGYPIGMKYKFLGSNELSKEGLKTLYQESIIHMKKKENSLQQITFFGIDDKGNFYQKTQVKGDGYAVSYFSKEFFKGIQDQVFVNSDGIKELFKAENRRNIIIDTLDKNYNLGIKELYDELQEQRESSLEKENFQEKLKTIPKKINKKKKDTELER